MALAKYKHIFALCVAASPVLAQSPIKETRNLVEKWVESRQLSSQLKADWQVEKEVLEQSISAFEGELSSLDAQMEKVDTGKTQVSSEFETVNQEKDALTAYSGRLKEEVARLEVRLNKLADQLPIGVKERISPLLDRIPENPAETKLSVSTRMQNVLGVINEVDKFNGGVTVVSELRKNTEGADVQVQVLYVGLAQAYFSDPTGAFAGTGKPGANGWDWSIQPELGEKILNAINIYLGSQPAAFVNLPFQLK